ncbi:MAG: hypothetical protein HC806_00060 [Anaerolineae bacterium]|nr:hypothetical protein [Anaerolineae bacterium]
MLLLSKAELARQFGDWAVGYPPGQEAGALGYEPTNPFEWFPFIEADVRLDKWEEARTQIITAYSQSKQTRDRLAFCKFWQSIAPHDPTDVSTELGCASPS